MKVIVIIVSAFWSVIPTWAQHQVVSDPPEVLGPFTLLATHDAVDEANYLQPADAVRLINTFTSHGHLLTKNQRARLKRPSARASHRRSAA